MAEIRDGVFVRNETNKNSMGGTERITQELANRADKDLLKEFQIVSSRIRDLQEDKIRIFYCHDLPGDPESDFLKDKSKHDLFHKYVFVSNWQMQGYMQQYGLPWSKCIVVKNAIEPIKEHKKPDPKEKLNFIYTPTPHRGLNILVPVFSALAEKYPHIHLNVYSSFKLYGWEERDEQYKELFEIIKQHPNMSYHGTQSNECVRAALCNAHIFAYPSIWAETSCLSLIEAMSAQLLCVHSNYGALAETSAGWTNMYQLHEDLNQHAGIFYNILEGTIQNYETQSSFQQSMKTYTDLMYSWNWRTFEWNALLNMLYINTKDRSFPKEKFFYKTQ
jgi:UDP-glucose:(glucosyl)LPS alpha-1,2-glucosyltransferase